MKALDRKLLRDLWQMRSQAFTIALVVASGIGSFIALLSTYDSLQWSRDIALPAWTGTDITINLDVPADQPATSNRDSSSAIVWELHVTGGPARAPIRWVFPLPVFVP